MTITWTQDRDDLHAHYGDWRIEVQKWTNRYSLELRNGALDSISISRPTQQECKDLAVALLAVLDAHP